MEKYNFNIDKSKKETDQHGTIEFPLGIYTTQISKRALGFIDWHWHDELQFCVVTDGCVEFQVKDTKLILTAGEGLFINAGQLHKAKNHLNSDSTYICIEFRANMISSFTGSAINNLYIQPYTNKPEIQYCMFKNLSTWQEKVLRNLASIYQVYHQREVGYELRTVILLLEIWEMLTIHYFPTKIYQEYADSYRTKSVLAYINKHYMDKIELADLAELISLSKHACCREFKKQMNCTIFEYLLNYRLEMSAQLLVSTEDSITNIAYQCGFGSASYYIDKFKRKIGMTPLSYRKSHRNF